MSQNIILGYGILGKELVSKTGWDYLSRSSNNDFNFEDVNTYKKIISKYQVVINCIANTNTYGSNKKEHWNVNYKAVSDLVELCNKNKQKLIHISTDYVYANSIPNASEYDVPVHNNTWYSYTKLLSDAYIQLKSNDYLIIRCGHKEYPFKYKRAFKDVEGNFDYVQNIANIIISLVNKNVKNVINVGTKKKTMYDLAKESNPSVIESLSENENMPKNVSMDLTKLEKVL